MAMRGAIRAWREGVREKEMDGPWILRFLERSGCRPVGEAVKRRIGTCEGTGIGRGGTHGIAYHDDVRFRIAEGPQTVELFLP